jgi:FKBP-type peptidyl-prolyl cis-trans isomerase 2
MNKGDIVRWDYEGWTVGAKPEENELFETTSEALAREKDIHKEGALYGPAPLIIGADRMVKGLESSLLAVEIGKEVEVTILPAEAYGDRDPKKVEVHSMAEIMRLPEFKKGEEEVMPGARVVLNNKAGTIISANPGRVRVDFNHQLAGKTLKYKYTIRSKAETVHDKVSSILEMYYGKPGDFKVHVRGEEADIVLMEQCKYDPRWLLTKLQRVRDLREYACMNKVRLIEEYVKPEEKKDEKAPAPEGAAPPAAEGGAEKAAPEGGHGEQAPAHDHEHPHEHPAGHPHEHAGEKKEEAPKP